MMRKYLFYNFYFLSGLPLWILTKVTYFMLHFLYLKQCFYVMLVRKIQKKNFLVSHLDLQALQASIINNKIHKNTTKPKKKTPSNKQTNEASGMRI